MVLVLNNQDLSQVTWEQRVMAGDPKFAASQDVPAFPYARYAEILGLKGIELAKTDQLIGMVVLKRDATRPPQANLRAQQRVLNNFRYEYNYIRPHEALNGAVPGDLYSPSPRPFPRKLEPIVYPAHFELRLVSKNGGIRWFDSWVNVSHLLAGEYIGLEEIDAGIFNVFFGPVWLGYFREDKLRIFDNDGRAQRRTGGNHKGR